jgi:hypothetical protein
MDIAREAFGEMRGLTAEEAASFKKVRDGLFKPVGHEDTARLDWLEQWLKVDDTRSNYLEAYQDGDVWLFSMGNIPDSYGPGPMTIAKAPSVREAIDAAMRGK